MRKTISSIILAMLVIISFNLVACTSGRDTAPATLSVEQHPLKAPPQIEPLMITPLEGSQEEMLKLHADERSLSFPDQSTSIDGNPAFAGTLEGKPLIAGQTFINNYSESYAWVTQDGTEIYRIPTGPASPLTSLRGLWVYDGHWALETVLIDLEGDDITTPFALGQVTIDGLLQNETQGYQDAFGLQTIAGKPFFFFKKDGKIGYSYNGQESMPGYDEIPHYKCCSESALNPIQAQNMVAFLARTGEAWYYVEMGVFSK